MIKNPKRIVISRTDSIGDVILTLPLAGILKERFPLAHLVFLGNTYTKPIIACCEHVDEIWEWAELEKMEDNERIEWLAAQEIDTFLHIFPRRTIAKWAKKAKISNRVGTSHRIFHWLTCNYKPNFTRKNSTLHEAQLNTKLLEPLRIGSDFSLKELNELIGFTKIPSLPPHFKSLIKADTKNIILHAKSQGSAVEWGVDQFVELAKILSRNQINVFFTGTEKEAQFFRDKLPQSPFIHDVAGQMTLDELIAFIAHADGLIAASTGPLHLAGVLNINTIGLFSSIKPIHAGRWKPLGNRVLVIEDKKNTDFSQPLSISIRDVLKGVENSSKK